MDHTDQQSTIPNIDTTKSDSDNGSDVSTKLRSLDTVKALYETVTTLRNALEDSRNEVSKLKQQISVITEIDQRTKKVKGKSSPLKFSPRSRCKSKKVQFNRRINSSKEPERKLRKLGTTTAAFNIGAKEKKNQQCTKTEVISIQPNLSFKPTTSDLLGMASRIDVKIKVSSNIQVDNGSSNSSSEDSEQVGSSKDTSNDNEGDKPEKPPSNDEHAADEDQTTTKQDSLTVDEKSVNLKVSSKENLSVINTSKHINVTHTSTENLHLEVDNVSQNSISEGDNSVFIDNPPQQPSPPLEHDGGAVASNIVAKKNVTHKFSKDSMDQTEEVDDIDLIFSSDDNKEIINQEDLVSISEYEPWQQGESGTPILINFRRLTSDTQIDGDDRDNIEHNKRRSRATNRQHSEDLQKSLESTDSLSFDHRHNSLDFNTKSSSLDKDSSLEQPSGVCRDESFDTFESEHRGVSQRKWTNLNVLIETDISKCGIHDETAIDMGRRNTCPNPTPYRPIIHAPVRSSGRNPLAVKFCRSPRNYMSPNHNSPNRQSTRPIMSDSCRMGPKTCSSAQTDITALPQCWRSETQLTDGQYAGLYTLPSKFTPPRYGTGKSALRPGEKTQEARRVMLSDINFTSMVPELSRSADHLCHEKVFIEKYPQMSDHQNQTYYKGNQLKTPDYASRGLTSNFSMSPNVSQWTVNETSFGTQAPFGTRGDSFDSIGSRSIGSRYSSTLSRHHRSRSVPSIRCTICRQNHGLSLRTSESMHYGGKVQFQESHHKTNVRGSLPDLRHMCSCSKRYGGPSLYRIHADSAGSTDSLLEEAEEYLRHSMDGLSGDDARGFGKGGARRNSENDILKDYAPSKQSLPFLPKSSTCLKPGHLAKVITKTGRVVVGRVRYVGPLAGGDADFYIGLQLQNSFGDCDGSVDGRKFFDCQPLHGIFVPFKKIVMAWNS